MWRGSELPLDHPEEGFKPEGSPRDNAVEDLAVERHEPVRPARYRCVHYASRKLAVQVRLH